MGLSVRMILSLSRQRFLKLIGNCVRHLEAAYENTNTFGRIVLCGTTSQYDENSAPTAPINKNDISISDEFS
jgi:NADPH-dependent curcumin reductase CurA